MCSVTDTSSSNEKMTTNDCSDYSESEMETVPGGFCRRLPRRYLSDQRLVTDFMDSRLCWVDAEFDHQKHFGLNKHKEHKIFYTDLLNFLQNSCETS